MNRLRRPEEWREVIIRGAVEIARKPEGWSNLTKARIAHHVGCSQKSIVKHVGDSNVVRDHVVRFAKQNRIAEILVQTKIPIAQQRHESISRKRRDAIVKAAVEVARRPGGWRSLTRVAIAKEANCSPALVSLHVGDMDNVRKSVMRVAVRQEISEIILQSAVCNDGYAKLSPRHRALLSNLLGK